LIFPHGATDPEIASVAMADQSGYLQTSPEFAMKRLLSAGSDSIFQICHAFRDAEVGRLHHREFSMLEWYCVGYDYQRLMDEIELLITTLSLSQCQFTRISYRELFRQRLDVDIESIGLSELRAVCTLQVGECDSSQLDFNQCLDLLMGMIVAPSINGYLFVYDYPASQASLARLNPGNSRVAERFELFFDGIELANGFSELSDSEEQRARFIEDNRVRRERGLPEMALDEKLLAALAHGLPECAGVALGLDRLLMALLELDSIDQVLTFAD
ncbi:MAG: EF-P lysine aminoacylase EpmA, partial [Pseudomonadota bacterium]